MGHRVVGMQKPVLRVFNADLVYIGTHVHIDPFFKTVIDVGFAAKARSRHIFNQNRRRKISFDIFQCVGYDGIFPGIIPFNRDFFPRMDIF
jgi:hypothetical protein